MPARLALVLAIAVSMLGGGCLGTSGPGSPATGPIDDGALAYESYVFDHGGAERPAIEGGIRYDSEGDRYYATLVTTREDADRFNTDVLDAGAQTFVEETDFDGSYLLVIQSYPASSVPDYRVERAERVDDEVQVHINDSSQGGTDDVTVETVLVRIDLDSDVPPERAVVVTQEGVSFTSDGAGMGTPAPTQTS